MRSRIIHSTQRIRDSVNRSRHGIDWTRISQLFQLYGRLSVSYLLSDKATREMHAHLRIGRCRVKLVRISTYNVYLNAVNHAISTKIFPKKGPLQREKILRVFQEFQELFKEVSRAFQGVL